MELEAIFYTSQFDVNSFTLQLDMYGNCILLYLFCYFQVTLQTQDMFLVSFFVSIVELYRREVTKNVGFIFI